MVLGEANPKRGDQAGAKKLVVGAPPERVIDNIGALEHGVFEIGAIIGDFVADAVNQDGIFARFIHARATQLDIFGHHTSIAAIDLFQKCWRKAPFPPNDETDLFDVAHSSPC